MLASTLRRLATTSVEAALRFQKGRALDALERAERADLQRLFPDLVAAQPAMAALRDEYRPMWERYVRDVSHPHAALSLEQVGLLVHLVRNTPVKRIADMGSGFSTFVLRRETERKGGVYHLAVDDDEGWRGKTVEFLAANNLPTGDVIGWPQYAADRAAYDRFDMVFHDLGHSTMRILSLPVILERVVPGGLLILDDMHKVHLRPHALALTANGFDRTSAVALTRDPRGRYAYLCRKR